MNVAKSAKILSALSGFLFSAFICLLIVWDLAGEHPFINPFPNKWIWGAPGLILGLFLTGSAYLLKRAIDISTDRTDPTDRAKSSVFVILSIITQMDREASNAIGGIVLCLIPIALNIFSVKQGTWKLSETFIIFMVGTLCSLLFKNFVKADTDANVEAQNKPITQVTPSKWRSSFIAEVSGETIKLTLPVSGAIRPDQFSFSIHLSEIDDFRIFATMEEARGFRDRNLSGDIELIANAFAAQMKFWFKPETCPQYYLSDNWSSGDFYVYFSGKSFTYFLAFQP